MANPSTPPHSCLPVAARADLGAAGSPTHQNRSAHSSPHCQPRGRPHHSVLLLMRCSLLVRQTYQPLSAQKRADLVARKWKIIDGHLCKRFALPSHTEAAAFAWRVAQRADEMNHHPEVAIRYRFVSFSLRTNDADMLSETDEKLAYIIDDLKVVNANT